MSFFLPHIQSSCPARAPGSLLPPGRARAGARAKLGAAMGRPLFREGFPSPGLRGQQRSGALGCSSQWRPLVFADCAGCKEEIKHGQSLLALDKQWHVSCFKCQTCSVILTGEYISKWVSPPSPSLPGFQDPCISPACPRGPSPGSPGPPPSTWPPATTLPQPQRTALQPPGPSMPLPLPEMLLLPCSLLPSLWSLSAASRFPGDLLRSLLPPLPQPQPSRGLFPSCRLTPFAIILSSMLTSGNDDNPSYRSPRFYDIQRIC